MDGNSKVVRSPLVRIKELPVSIQEQEVISRVAGRYPFRLTQHYARLINWDNPQDPIRRIVIPDQSELDDWGSWDASEEHLYTPIRGLEHKYRNTALLLVNDICGSFCRFCFRKRLFQEDNFEALRLNHLALEYIRAHPEITNVLLTGGDPLFLTTKDIKLLITELVRGTHIRLIRFGSKMAAFDPERITSDRSLHELFRSLSDAGVRVNMMVHFNHPREFTDETISALANLSSAGVILYNQTPLIRGVNDCKEVLRELLEKCVQHRIVPYYVFQVRPTIGNKGFQMPLLEAFSVTRDCVVGAPGFLRTFRLIMSHKIGKIEVLHVDKTQGIFRVHEATDETMFGRILHGTAIKADAAWLDDFAIEKDGVSRPIL